MQKTCVRYSVEQNHLITVAGLLLHCIIFCGKHLFHYKVPLAIFALSGSLHCVPGRQGIKKAGAICSGL